MNNKFNTDYTDGFPHKELSYKFIGICINIHNEYGNNHNERIYHKLVEEGCARENLLFTSKPKIPVYSKESGKEIGCYYPDGLLENVILIEMKANPLTLNRDEKQLAEYLKITPYEIAYLINFGTQKLYYKRLIYTNDRKNFLSTPKKVSVQSVFICKKSVFNL